MIRAGNMSWLIGDAWPRTPIPAVTFRQSTTQSSQNCGVLNAVPTATWALVTSFCEPAGLGHEARGRHPAAGTRTVSTPNIMKTK